MLWKHGGKIFIGLPLCVAVNILCIKCESRDVPVIAQAILKTLQESPAFSYLGWGLAACFLLLNLVSLPLTIWIYKSELRRVAGERDRFQELAIGKRVSHSGRG